MVFCDNFELMSLISDALYEKDPTLSFVVLPRCDPVSNVWRVSLRSQGSVDVDAIGLEINASFKFVGGGGHPMAAGCLVPFVSAGKSGLERVWTLKQDTNTDISK